MTTDDKALLVARYERLRRLLGDLDLQTHLIDRELLRIEGRLPADYLHPDDPPQASAQTDDNPHF